MAERNAPTPSLPTVTTCRPYVRARASGGAPSTGVKGFIDAAVDAAGRADGELAALQDSMLPVEVGDAELRAGLQEVRELIGELRGRARELVRTLGR